MAKTNRNPSLFKIIAVIVAIGGIAFGVFQISTFFENYVNGNVEAAALENLDRARNLAAEGHAAEARELLRPILARVENPDIAPKAHLLQAELDHLDGNLTQALEHLRAAAEDFEGSSIQPEALLAYAELLEETGRSDDALEAYTRVRDMAPPSLRAPALTALARYKSQANDRDGAYTLYREAISDAEWGSPTWLEAIEQVGDMNVAALFSSVPTDDSKVYRVSSGDTLTTIGMKLNTTQGLLMRANNLDDPNRLRLNQNLKYTAKDFEVLIELSTMRLYLLDKDGIFNVYSVGLGKPGNGTTPGRYKIGNKEKNPTWYKPGFGPIPPLDPANELGTRWMPLIPEEEGLPNDLGIHGTINPSSIGIYSSMGCPRLHKEDVEELYDLIVRSTPVIIVETFDNGNRA